MPILLHPNGPAAAEVSASNGLAPGQMKPPRNKATHVRRAGEMNPDSLALAAGGVAPHGEPAVAISYDDFRAFLRRVKQLEARLSEEQSRADRAEAKLAALTAQEV